MTRLFLDEAILAEKIVYITGEKAHYLSAVLRCKAHDNLLVTDRSGSVYAATISAITKKQATLNITGPFNQDNEPPLDIILFQGLLKGEKMDLVIQKSTELGATEIVPMITERSQVRETRKLQRWQKIAVESSRQCGRNRIPLIHEPAAFESVIMADGLPKGIICWEKEGVLPFSSSLEALKGQKQIVLCIGPEGGFSEKEVRQAESREFAVASLGKRILRAETAAISAIAISQYVLGDLSGRT
ncbi:MAG: 16S rRNA (uracil(1498)-N(3))-methyltransferase [Nitrospirae bacterium]|nr:16S rRNA (uracil(1498)-N(3))-methyltransferase [Nitrospirota bacterium]